jgi:hypothetical protein
MSGCFLKHPCALLRQLPQQVGDAATTVVTGRVGRNKRGSSVVELQVSAVIAGVARAPWCPEVKDP